MGPQSRGIQERFLQEATSAPCLERQTPLAKGKGQACQAVVWALATAVRWEGRLVRGGVQRGSF